MIYPFGEKGKKLPIEIIQRGFTPCVDGQDYFNFTLFAGEEIIPNEGDNLKKIGNLIIPFQNDVKADEFEMVVKFYINRSGIIRSTVRKEKNGKKLGNLNCKMDFLEINEKIKDLVDHLKGFGF